MEASNSKPNGLHIYQQVEEIEKLINDSKPTQEYAKLFSIPRSWYQFILVVDSDLKNDVNYQPGHPVKVILKWPDVLPRIGGIVRNALFTISKYKLHKTMEIVPYFLNKQWIKDAKKKWEKEYFGIDQSSLIYDLLPKNRLEQIVSETVTVRDIITGESISITRNSKPEHFDGNDMSLWMQLSRQVKTKYPEQEEFDIDDTLLPG